MNDFWFTKYMFYIMCLSIVVYFDVQLCPYLHWQEHLLKQGMKADQAASLVEMTAAKCSTVKYDVELAEEYIARQVIFTMLSFDHWVY